MNDCTSFFQIWSHQNRLVSTISILISIECVYWIFIQFFSWTNNSILYFWAKPSESVRRMNLMSSFFFQDEIDNTIWTYFNYLKFFQLFIFSFFFHLSRRECAQCTLLTMYTMKKKRHFTLTKTCSNWNASKLSKIIYLSIEYCNNLLFTKFEISQNSLEYKHRWTWNFVAKSFFFIIMKWEIVKKLSNAPIKYQKSLKASINT